MRWPAVVFGAVLLAACTSAPSATPENSSTTRSSPTVRTVTTARGKYFCISATSDGEVTYTSVVVDGECVFDD